MRALLRSQPGPAGTRDEARPLDERDIPSPSLREPRYVPDDVVAMAPDAVSGCVVIERQYDLQTPHGRYAVGHYAAIVERAVPALAVLAADDRQAASDRRWRTGRLRWDDDRQVPTGIGPPRAPASGPLLFFDLETTGLSGGAGTVAFLVGCGYFGADGFRTRQYFLSGYEAERDLLASLTALTREFGGLVSFNGRTFDVPLIDTRYLFHRLESPFAAMPHFDMLHTARRLWRRREAEFASVEPWAFARPADPASCALGSLEEAILGVQRFGDVPGMEIPSRYFHYLRTGDLAPLDPVFEHNRLDLVSLAALTAIAMRLAEEGPEAASSASEALAMGTIYERSGRTELAEACYASAAACDLHGSSAGKARVGSRSTKGGRAVRAEALRRLAVARRRQRRYDAAAQAWQLMLHEDLGPEATRDARQALAVHHEHRSRDLESARTLAEQALAAETDEAAAAALRHRLARLERKIDRSKRG